MAESPQVDPAQTRLLSDWESPGQTLACRFDPSGQYLFTSLMDFSILRWRCADGAHVAFKAHESWVRALACAPAGDVLYSAGYDGRLIWWPIEGDSPQPARVVEAHSGWIRGVAASPSGAWLATAGNDNRACIWDATNGAMLAALPHDTQVHSVCFHPTAPRLFTGDLKGRVREWDLAPLSAGSAPSETRQFDATPLYLYFGGQGVDFGGVRALVVSPDGKWLVAAGTTEATNPLGAIHKPLALRFDLATGEKTQTHRGKDDLNGVMWNVAFHPQRGDLVGVTGGSGGGKLFFFGAEGPNETVKIDLPNLARDMDLARDGLRLATVHSDKHVRLWTMAAK